MTNNRVSSYTIDLEIKEGDETRANIDRIEKSIKALGESTKNGIADGLASASAQADALIKQVKEIANGEKSATSEITAFNRATSRTIGDLEKQATIINYSLSDAGKAQRERIKAINDELNVIRQIGGDKKRQSALEKELTALQKDVIDGTDDQLKSALENNKLIRSRLKMAQAETLAIKAQQKEQKTLKSLVKDDLTAIREKIKAQFAFIKTLKTTEGLYKGMKKLAGTAAKGAGIVGAGIVGGAIAAGGMAVASADRYVEREREARRIKASMSDDDKNALLGEMYIKTGADYRTIVDAINRVTSVLGTPNRDDIAQAAVTEIKYPGAAAMFRQQNTGNVGANDFNVYANRMKSIQGATGASVEQVTASTKKIANMRQSAFSNASMTDLQALYLALQGSGAYDTQEELDRVFSGFVRRQKDSGENVFDFAEKYFRSSEGMARGVYGATNRQQATKALSNLDFSAVRSAASESETIMPATAAEKTAEAMRNFEEKKNQILMKLLKAIEPLADELLKDLDDGRLKKIADGLISFLTRAVPVITDVIMWVAEKIGVIGGAVGSAIEAVGKASPEYKNVQRDAFSMGKMMANGGIATMPMICGERGPEMVIPLSHDRAARGAQLTQNFVQNFRMSGNETTALSLSQAVRSRDFTRAMSNNTYISGRLGR